MDLRSPITHAISRNRAMMRSNSTLSLPTTQRRKFQRAQPKFMSRILFLATLFSALSLIRHVHTRSYFFRSTFVPVETIIPGRSFVHPHDLSSFHALEVKPRITVKSSPTKAPVIHSATNEDRSVTQKQENHESRTSQSAKTQTSPTWRDPADFSTFDRSTTLNYFHMHKTGGVSFKERLFDFFINETDTSGRKAKVFDTCHTSTTIRNELGREKQWSCDWDQITNLPETARNKIDVVVGHQYWEQGAGYWIPNRDVRYFTVMRHPLHRKISFFYHFFVRNSGRNENSVSSDELIDFVLGRRMADSPLVRDAGPGYYASRLWSDGLRGYNDYHRFAISDETAGSMVESSIRRLRKNFVFIGLQTQEAASLCMLQKTVEAFVKAHEFEYTGGFRELSRQRERMNAGSYSLSAETVWKNMSFVQRTEFKKVERVDLGIYRESVKMFREMVGRFDCEELVVDSEDDEIAL